MSPRLHIAPGVRLEADSSVVDIANEQQAVEAFEHYAAKARELVDDPMLLCDLEFNQELERRRARWVRLFTFQDDRR